MRSPFVRPVLAVLALAAAAAPAGLAGVAREGIPFPFGFDPATFDSSPPAIAATPDGASHVLYPQAGQVLHHAWRRGGAWRDEVVDPRYAWSEIQSIAVDGLGRLHAAYTAYDGPSIGVGTVMHGVRGDSGWSLTEIAPGRSAVLYLGPDDRPRVVFQGPDRMEVATFDGSAWTVGDFGPAPPDSIRPLALLSDAQGRLHALADRGDGSGGDYATDATGSWVKTTEWGETLALDAEGHPHIGTEAATGIAESWDRLVHRWIDGVEWRSEDVFAWGPRGTASASRGRSASATSGPAGRGRRGSASTSPTTPSSTGGTSRSEPPGASRPSGREGGRASRSTSASRAPSRGSASSRSSTRPPSSTTSTARTTRPRSSSGSRVRIAPPCRLC